MDDLELIAQFAQTGGADEASRQTIESKLERRIIAAERRGRLGATGRAHPRRRLVGFSAAGAVLAVAAIVAALLTVGSPGGGAPENAYAAVKQAADVTAASAQASGMAIASISHNGNAVITNTLRWNGDNVSLTHDDPQTPAEVRFVGGNVYQRMGPTKQGADPEAKNNWLDGRWRNYGPGDPQSFGRAWLASTQPDISGATLKKIAAAITGLNEAVNDDGSKTYSGKGSAAVIVGEMGFPYGIRPLGGADKPSTPMNIKLTVGADGMIRQLKASYGADDSWVYSVEYTQLGSAPAVTAPQNAIDVTPGG